MGINAQIPANLDFSRFAGIFTILIRTIVYKKLCILILRVMACFFHELVIFLLRMQQEMIRLPGRY